MLQRLKDVNYHWILLSFCLAIISHILRAYRWNLLLQPLGYQLTTFRTFLAVMVGYFANLIIPRAGEISRCGILKKTDNVNMTNSIGTVVAERAVDLVMLLVVVFIAFLVEFRLLNDYLFGFFQSKLVQISRNMIIIYLGGGMALFLILMLFIVVSRYKEKLKQNVLFLKFRHFMRELIEGLTSIRKLNNRLGFVVSSVFIWVLYFLMSYVAFFAIPETSGLGLVAGLSILAMSSLGMLAPVQGGIGAYHALVAGVLVFYGVGDHVSAFFAGLLHSSQVLLIIVVGGISFFTSLYIPKKNARIEDVQVSEHV